MFDCKIPFLNGGLFEPINDYDWVNVRIPLENSIFESILGTFDRFNFTIKEDEPLDKEVAVDPEMLGKVFENLLDVTDRKSKGAFYTPREIVHYMFQQSLINYIETNTDVPVGDIETFIQHGELAQQITSKVNVDEKYIPASIKNDWDKINDLLKNIKIVDPAVGSGAFPMGMMNEIVKARSILSWLSKEEKLNYYDLKRETIENCLYGVDIDSSAVDITKLRFWLSLVVDETDIKKIKPLPNLDHRIMCGNSLLEEFEGVKLFDEQLLEVIPETSDFEVGQINTEIEKLYTELGEIHTGKRKDNGRKKEIGTELKKLERKRKVILSGPKDETQQSTFDSVLENRKKESQKKLAELKRLHEVYFNEQGRRRKKELAGDIDRIEWELVEETLKEQGNEDAMQKLAQYKKNKSKPFFLWKLYFSDVFQRENPGFDVVIANPPYIEQRKLKQFRNIYQKQFSVYSGMADIYVYFYEKGIRLLNEGGVLCYISSNKFLKTSYGQKLREFLAQRRVKQVIDFSEIHVFEALVSSCIIVTKEKQPIGNVLVSFVNDQLTSFGNLNDFVSENKIEVNQKTLGKEIWQLVCEDKLKLKQKIEKAGNPISKIKSISINRGITTGYNPAFIINEVTVKELIQEDIKSKDLIKPLLQGRNIRKWHYNYNSEYLLFAHRSYKIEGYSSIFKRLKSFKAELENRQNVIRDGELWWQIPYSISYRDDFENEKIIWGLTANKWAFAYDNKGHYLPSNGYILTSSEIPIKYLLGLLNSNLMNFYFGFIGIMTAGGAFTLKHETIREFPIIEILSEQRKTIIFFVDQILSITSASDYPNNPHKQSQVKTLEKEIDQLVYKLYDLTPEEIAIVENFNKGK